MFRVANKQSIGTIIFQMSFLVYSSICQAQVLSQNLQGNDVYSLTVEDSSSILLATSRGLLRFDGQKFEDFPIQVSGRVPPSREMVDMVIDKDQNIWVTEISWSTGMSGLYVKKGVEWINIDRDSGAPESQIMDIFVDSYGRVWLATRENGVTIFYGESKYRINGTRYEVFENNSWSLQADLVTILPNALKNISAIGQNANGEIWLGSENGVIRFSPGSSILDSSAVANPEHWKHFLETEYILSIKGDNQGRVWVGTLENGIFRFEANGDYQNFKPGVILGISQFEVTFLDWNRINTIEQDIDENLWFGTAEGVCRFNPNAQNSTNQWRFMDPETHSGFRVGVETIFNDFDNNLWFGLSTGQGVLRFNNNWFTFGQESLGDFPFVRTLLVNNTDAWVGTVYGIVRIRGEDPLPTMRAGFQNQIWSLTPAKNSQVWVGTFGDGVFLYDENGIQLCHLDTTGQPDAMGIRLIDPNKQVMDIIERNDEVWIATLQGLSRFSLSDSSWTNYTKEDGLISNSILSIAFDHSGKLWCGTPEGISVLNPETNEWDPPLTTANGLSNNIISAIVSHPRIDEMWMGTDGGGISIYDSTGWHYLNRTTFLADNVINQIVFSQNGDEVWVATPRGVNRRNTTGLWTTFNTQSGLASDLVQTIALQGDSLRWFGTWGSGLTRYRPPQSLPETFIDSRLDVTDKSEVTYHFSAADLNTERNEFRFQYWIDNQNPSDPTADHFAVVAVPEPVTGPHTFYVRAIDRDGNYDPEPATDYFHRVDRKLGGYTTFVDTTSFSKIDSVVVKVYWPPNLLAPNTEIFIEPTAMNNSDSLTLFAFDLSANNMTIEKPVTLEFIFPINEHTNSRHWGIYKGDSENYTLFGGTTKTVGDNFKITTAIQKLGRYSVREIGSDFSPTSLAELATDVQPRIFSPSGGGLSTTTTLSFNLQQSTQVKIKVYNLAGRLVETICEQEMQAGVNAVIWNGKDRNNQICPTGLYIFTIESDILNKSEKVMIMHK